MDMKLRAALLDLLYRALIEIRSAAQAGDTDACYWLAYLSHNIPDSLRDNPIRRERIEYLLWVERPCFEEHCKNPFYRRVLDGVFFTIEQALK